ncbi:MAG: hypothetical protein V1905_02260 [bacterium]
MTKLTSRDTIITMAMNSNRRELELCCSYSFNNLFIKINHFVNAIKNMNRFRNIFIFSVAAISCLVPVVVFGAQLGFNVMSGDLEGLVMKNVTQGTPSWTDPISANSGDTVRFEAFYHCGRNDTITPTELALNTKLRFTAPTTGQSVITVNYRVSADNILPGSDTGTINATTSQKLVFSNTATWYHDGTSQTVSMTTGDGYAEVNIGSVVCDCIGCFNNSGFLTINAQLINPPALVPTVDIKANNSDGPITIAYNSPATLIWNSNNATSCAASNGWSGTKATNGSDTTGNLVGSVTYTITCTGQGGSATDSVTVNTNSALPTVDLKANGYDGSITVPYNTSVILSWISTNSTICTASNGWSGTKSLNGSEGTGNLLSNVTYTITCTGQGGSASDTVYVSVGTQPPAQNPTVDIKANGYDGSINIPYNNTATLTWTSYNATSCTAMNGWSGSKGVSGSEITENLTNTKTYTIVCYGTSGNSVSDSVTVTVSDQSLYVSLTVNPAIGTAPLNGVDLTADVFGGATGSINYIFYCNRSDTGTNITSDYNNRTDGTYSDPITVADACNYSTAGTYTAKVIAQRGSLSAENRATITVNGQYAQNAPTVDLKANGFDGTISIPINAAAMLGWTSLNASSCSFTAGASGSRAISGTESTGILLANRTYTITCFGSNGRTATDTVTVNTSSTSTLEVTKQVRSITDNTVFVDEITVRPGAKLEFMVKIRNNSTVGLANMIVKDIFPAKINYAGNLKIDGVYSTDSITQVNIGDLTVGQTKTLTFEATVPDSAQFAFGASAWVNTVTVYNVAASVTDTATINVNRTQVAGATTIPTGIASKLIDYVFIPSAIALFLVWALRKYLLVFDQWISKKKLAISQYKAEKELSKTVNYIRMRERNNG